MTSTAAVHLENQDKNQESMKKEGRHEWMSETGCRLYCASHCDCVFRATKPCSDITSCTSLATAELSHSTAQVSDTVQPERHHVHVCHGCFRIVQSHL